MTWRLIVSNHIDRVKGQKKVKQNCSLFKIYTSVTVRNNVSSFLTQLNPLCLRVQSTSVRSRNSKAMPMVKCELEAVESGFDAVPYSS